MRTMRIKEFIAIAIVLAAGFAAAGTSAASVTDGWSDEERELIGSLSISRLGPVPADPSNRVADDPGAAALGHRLFFDTRLSSTGTVACATCHDPARGFQDGTALAKGVGTTNRRTMPIASGAWSPWQFWDGRKDSQWAQALGPLESPVEHGGTRAQYAHVILTYYRRQFEAIFGRLPSLDGIPEQAGPVADAVARAAWDALPRYTQDDITSIYVNIGKSIAAYERVIRHGRTRFDRFADALSSTGHELAGVLSADERAGLRLFVGRAQCINCHNGPRFTDDFFHNTGVAAARGLPHDAGRALGATQVRDDEFNCLSRWSDAPRPACRELEFMITGGPELERAFKTPSLRDVAERAPYMHAGQLADLDAVIAHYDRAPSAPSGRSELKRLRLDARERAQLVAFLRTLSAPLDAPDGMLEPPR
jgi:cytochrome c peroxidase